MAHQLKLAVDGVVDANHVFTDIGRLGDGRNVLTGAEVWLWEGPRIQFEDGILVDQVGGDDVSWERLSRSQAVTLVNQKLGWVTGGRNYRRRSARGNGIGQGRSGRGEIAG